MKVNQWIALVDVFDLFQLKRYCTVKELDDIQKMLELEIMAELVDLRLPDLPNEEDTLDVIAEVKKSFILEYLKEAEDENEAMTGITEKVEHLLNDQECTPQELEDILYEFYKADEI